MEGGDIVEILRAKRDGKTLDAEQIQSFCRGVADGSASDAQVGAFVMAAFCRGLGVDESAKLTRAMAASGWQADWEGWSLSGPRVDKHSTGGLGDIVSFLLAPMVAACGAHVPMISGRALGHTGGTIDKLESIPGFDPFPEPERFQRIVAEQGLAIVGQTASLVPADQRLYAARDRTATVESPALIAASILSKKLAEGLDALVIDLKVGNGAFMKDAEQGQPLADMLQAVAEACGMRCEVVFSDMNQPLANVVGDALEMREALRFLTGERRQPRLARVTLDLASRLLCLAGLADDPEAARAHLEGGLEQGQAAERFQGMVAALGGPADLLEAPDRYLPSAGASKPVVADTAGRLAAIDGRALGQAVHRVAGGAHGGQRNPAVGVAELVSLGERVIRGQVLGVAHAADEVSAADLAAATSQALTIEPTD